MITPLSSGDHSREPSDPPADVRPLLVLDGDNLAHRAYHSIPKTVRGEGGRPINAVIGWTNMVLGLWDSERPRAVFSAWDTPSTPTYRHALWPEYQAGRVFDADLLEQLDLLPELARTLGFGVGKQAGYEADDFMAAAAVREAGQGGSALLVTSDRDAYQLVTERVTVLAPRKGISDMPRIGEREVVERLGVLPGQVADFKALAGDASDNIPGAKGIGPKTAAALLLRYGSLDRVLEAGALAGVGDQPERLLTFREVVRPRMDMAVDLPPTGEPNWAAGAAALRGMGADALAKRLDQRGQRLPGL